jgi:hypothetical protein
MDLFGIVDIQQKMRRDLVQGFILHLIERKTLSRIDRSKGKFRSFLLASRKITYRTRQSVRVA